MASTQANKRKIESHWLTTPGNLASCFQIYANLGYLVTISLIYTKIKSFLVQIAKTGEKKKGKFDEFKSHLYINTSNSKSKQKPEYCFFVMIG